MSYHLGTVLDLDPVKVYGHWNISDPSIVARLTEAGMTIPPVDSAKGPTFLVIMDLGRSGMSTEVRSAGFSQPMGIPADLVGEVRSKIASSLAKISAIPTVPAAEVEKLAPRDTRQPTSSDPRELREPRLSRKTLDALRVGTQASDPGQVLPPTPPVPPAPTAVRSIRDNSRAGMYIGVGVAAVLLLVGLGAFRKGS